PSAYCRVTMWSVKCRPNPGAARIAARSSADRGAAEGRISKSDMRSRSWGGWGGSAGVDLDERGYRESARYLAPAYVDHDLVVLLQSRVHPDERQRDAGLEGRREGAGAGDAHISTVGPHGLTGPEDTAPGHLERVHATSGAGLLLP